MTYDNNKPCIKCGELGATHRTYSDEKIQGNRCNNCFEKRLRFTSMIFNRRYRQNYKVINVKVL